jgi:adenylosuccinate lyase
VLGEIDVPAIDAIEAVTKHDVIAFLTWAGEKLGPERRWLHQGMTSSDVLDTSLAVQLKQSADLLLEDLDQLLEVLKRRAVEHKMTPTIGRSHGIHAEPVTFGLKLAQAYAEFDRNRARLKAARDEIATCAISGAVGTYANVDPAVEEHVAKELGLTPEPTSTQVIPRDRHAMFFATLGVIASSIERLAIEIRHLQRTEVLEAEEYFSPGQKGSSAMPHKRNPVLTENLLAWPEWSVRRLFRQWRMSPYGMSGTSATRRSSGSLGRTPALPSISPSPASPAWSTSCWCIPSGCRRISTGWAAWSTPSASCSR